MKTVNLGGASVPVLGQGTWRLGENRGRRAEEAAALREGVSLGMTLIDTAEMYGEGATESFLGEALAGLRDEIFLVSKVYPHNAGQGRIERACEESLRRLKTDRLDLYLLHWRGDVPLEETVAGMEGLKAAGKIGAWGVSNFDVADMEDLIEAGGDGCAANQVLYNLTRRGPEFDLLPALSAQAVAAMAYSPIEQGVLPRRDSLDAIARAHSATPYQVALAWVLRRPGLIAIPKAGSVEHVRENAAAADIVLSDDELARLEADFPPPTHKQDLEML